MKRAIEESQVPIDDTDHQMKKLKSKQKEEDSTDQAESQTGSEFVNLDENLLFEILKHADAKTLAMSGCVNKLWHNTAQDERLWELICTKHLANIGCGSQQLRSVVLALGGFRRLHSLYLWPLSKPQPASASSSSWAPFAPMIGSKPPAKWGKDEVHLSLSLLSIRYYEKMNFSNKDKR